MRNSYGSPANVMDLPQKLRPPALESMSLLCVTQAMALDVLYQPEAPAASRASARRFRARGTKQQIGEPLRQALLTAASQRPPQPDLPNSALCD
jgi:hypothetical protein